MHFLQWHLSKILLREGIIDNNFIDNHTQNFEDYKKIIDEFSLDYLAVNVIFLLAELKN